MRRDESIFIFECKRRNPALQHLAVERKHFSMDSISVKSNTHTCYKMFCKYFNLFNNFYKSSSILQSLQPTDRDTTVNNCLQVMYFLLEVVYVKKNPSLNCMLKDYLTLHCNFQTALQHW